MAVEVVVVVVDAQRPSDMLVYLRDGSAQTILRSYQNCDEYLLEGKLRATDMIRLESKPWATRF